MSNPGPVPETIRVHPSRLEGQLDVPGDKSLSHRALLIGALVGQQVPISGLAPSGDVMAMAGAVASMGATIRLEPSGANVGGEVCGPLHEPDDVVDCGNAGTAMRLLAGVAAGIDGLTVLTGDRSLRSRPMDRVAAPLRALGASVDGVAGGARAPLAIRGGGLRSGEYTSPVASAQVKSAVLLAGQAAGVATSVSSPLPSRDHTERMLNLLGGDVRTAIDDANGEVVWLQPRALTSVPIAVAGDPSSAAFWLTASVLHGTSIRLPGVLVNPRRDGAERILCHMGASVGRDGEREQSGEPIADLHATGGDLAGGLEVAGADVVDAVDEIILLALAGAVSAGGLKVREAGELRVKESDRLDALERIAAALGLVVTTTADGFDVPGGQRVTGGGSIDAHGDHRVAMATAIAATTGSSPVEIRGCASIPTSYPGFLNDLAALGGEVEVLQMTDPT